MDAMSMLTGIVAGFLAAKIGTVIGGWIADRGERARLEAEEPPAPPGMPDEHAVANQLVAESANASPAPPNPKDLWWDDVGQTLSSTELEAVEWARRRVRGEELESGTLAEARQILSQYGVPPTAGENR